jgi:predicted phosphodiesterase
MRLLVVSDIHGDVEALRAVAAAEPHVDDVICLGDLVDYGPRPDATVAWVRDNVRTTLPGNHDNAVGFGRSVPFSAVAETESDEPAAALGMLRPPEMSPDLEQELLRRFESWTRPRGS